LLGDFCGLLRCNFAVSLYLSQAVSTQFYLLWKQALDQHWISSHSASFPLLGNLGGLVSVRFYLRSALSRLSQLSLSLMDKRRLSNNWNSVGW